MLRNRPAAIISKLLNQRPELESNRMSLLHGLVRNWAELRDDVRDPRLRPFVLPVTPAEALALTAETIARRPRWKVRERNNSAGTLHLTRATRIWRFVDDVHLKFASHPQGTRISGRSQARVGFGDLGQNARNLLELRAAVMGAIRACQED
jgi:uncharacterized protein (DUF1499 family)